MRFFNTAGPVKGEDHYCLPPLERFDLFEIEMLIAQKKYFVLHAPRQTGKTSYLLALSDHLNEQGKYNCLYFNVEGAQTARENVAEGMQAILTEIGSWAKRRLKDPFVEGIWPGMLARSGPHAVLGQVLTEWSQNSAKPLILLIDEIDSLVGDTLVAVLRQLRAGYPERPDLFPQSVILCGVRDVRDYRLEFAGQEKTTDGSAFNIKAKSLRLGNFTQNEIETLYAEHTSDTGQSFESEALALVWELTSGQPWLVNALAYEVCFEMKEGRDRSKPIRVEMINDAKERLILRRETHLDQLTEKLRQERVRRVIGPILAGSSRPDLIPEDDILYVRDLGLIRTDRGHIEIANRIYQEVIPRALTYSTQLTITHQTAWYVAPDGWLDMDKLLEAFQEFFRENSEVWIQRFREYHEAGPHLLLQAFLQRVVNSGGRVEREYALGSERTDLLVTWFHPAGRQRVVIELKIRYKGLKKTLKKALPQTYAYMDRSKTDEGHLVIFDRTKKKSWDEKIYKRSESYQGKAITVWGV
ncbi:MAG: AAA-like domain-containing protein [Ardenticatenaceae bacterium]